MAFQNKTKIVATVGPACRTMSGLRALIRAGVDVFRINGSYEDPVHHAKTIATIRQAARREKTPTAILVDLPGPKHRLGTLNPNETKLKTGMTITLACGTKAQTDDRIPVPDAAIGRALKAGDTVYINDGIVALKVLGKTGNDVRCKVTAGGPIRSGKGVNLPRVKLALPSLTARDRELARMAIEQDVDYVGLSFVRSAQNIKALRAIFKKRAAHIGIVAKIEKPEALDDLDNIIDATDVIMVARGDLGIELPFDQIPLIQKHILRKCLAAGKPAITATQMLESMVSAARPTRAEATDVAQAVWEGTDAVMLSEETSIGVNPSKAVRAMAHIARQAETEMPPLDAMERTRSTHGMQTLTVSRAAHLMAQQLAARAIVTPTRSGRTALYVSRLHPDTIILAPTSDEHTARRMSLYWGVVPMTMPTFKTLDEMLTAASRAARDSRLVKKGDTVVITSGAHSKDDTLASLVQIIRIG